MDINELITNKFIEQMEKGIIPWEKPWTGTCDGSFNRVSKKPYSFLNQMILVHTGEYASFKQWTDLGGKVRKGEKSEVVVFWKSFEKENDDGEMETHYTLRYLPVFHISQVDGIEPLYKEELPINKVETNENAENVFKAYIDREHITFSESLNDRACYSPMTDTIHLPLKEQFLDTSEYYSTLFHETTHSTGHHKRLNRIKENAHFGSEVYSKEELIAEMGSAFMLHHLGIETEKSFRNSTAYLQSWISVLRNDKNMIISASRKSEKAFKYILDIKESEEN